jgi:hypothetical protein
MSNPDLRITMPDRIDGEDLAEHDEIAVVQAALRTMADRVSQPFVRACLEQALEDIAHLTSCGGTSNGHAEEAAA